MRQGNLSRLPGGVDGVMFPNAVTPAFFTGETFETEEVA
jgi:hypothetical protein